MKRRALSLIISICLLFGVMAPAYAVSPAFGDVSGDAWYADAVDYAKENGLMNGTSENTFSPNGAMSRAMIVMILYHLAGDPDTEPTSTFFDVPTDEWYSIPVTWAEANDVISGYPNGMFAPNDPVTREQAATILWNYQGRPSAETAQTFADQEMISGYAADAVAWARGEGIINGKPENIFDPSGTITRAEMATMLYRWLSSDEELNDPKVHRILIAYFSCTGTTEAVAMEIAEITGANLYEITPEIPYTSEDLDYGNNASRANQEQSDPSVRPSISGTVEDMEQYDIVFLGYPIWHGQAPRVISTFLESYDFSEKTIVPFCTSHSSGIGSSDENLHELAPDADWLNGNRFAAASSSDVIRAWVDSLDLPVQDAAQ